MTEQIVTPKTPRRSTRKHKNAAKTSPRRSKRIREAQELRESAEARKNRGKRRRDVDQIPNRRSPKRVRLTGAAGAAGAGLFFCKIVFAKCLDVCVVEVSGSAKKKKIRTDMDVDSDLEGDDEVNTSS